MCEAACLSSIAFGADAFDDILCLVGNKPVWKIDGRDGVVFEAIGVAAQGTSKVDMVEVRMSMASADTIFAAARAVVYLVEHLLFGK